MSGPLVVHRYRVKAVMADSGPYKTVVRAAHPIAAAQKVMERLGLAALPAAPFALFVVPLGQSS